MSRGNLFANIEDKFRSADKEKIFKVALASIRDFFDAFDAIEQLEDNYKFGTMVVGARIGVAGGGKLNSQEKELIDEIFGRVWKGSMEEIYEKVGADIRDDDYEMVKGITQVGNAVAMPYLYYILSFAYIDGKIEDGIAERLESLFSANLLAGFFQSGMEEVPAQKIGLSGLEGEIVRWYKEDDKLRPLNEIQEHFSSRSDDEVQAALDSLVEKDILMCAETIVGKMYGFSGQDCEYYDSNDDEEEEESFDEAGTDQDDRAIGETGSEMYNWTFREGKTVRGDGWTIAIPDGFVQITSKDAEPLSGKKRLFELVPVTYKDEEDVDEIPVRILPGAVMEGVNSIGDYWMVHPEARAGVAGVVGVTAAEMVALLMGQGGEIFSVGWGDVAAYIIVNETLDQSYSYQCSVLIEDKNYQLRIQTQSISDTTKQRLNASIMAWLYTMRFDKPNKACPKKTIFEEDKCLSELLIGKTAKFEKAVEQAGSEYTSSVNGKIKMLEYMGENGLLDEHTGETVRDILEKGMQVKLFFLEKADSLIEKLKQNNADAGLIETVIEKLTALDDDCLYYEVDDEKIEIKIPEEVQAIRDKWKKLANAYGLGKKEAALSKAKKDLMDLEGQKRKAEAELLDLSVKKDKAKADYNAVATEYQNIEKEVQTKIDEIDNNIKILEAQIRQEKQKYKAGADERSSTLAGYRKKLKELTASYEVKEEVADAYKGKAERSILSKKKMLAVYEIKRSETESLRKRIDNIKKSMTDIEEEEKAERESHNKKVESCFSQKQEQDQKKTQLKSGLTVRTNEFEKAKKCYEDKVLAEKTISKKIEEINKKISSVKNEISKIEEEIASSKA